MSRYTMIHGTDPLLADVMKMINDDKHMAIASVIVDLTLPQPYAEHGVVYVSNSDTITITVHRQQIYPRPVPIVTQGRTVALRAFELQLENA